MRLKPPVHLQEVLEPGGTVEVSRTDEQGTLEVPAAFQKLPSWPLAICLCGGSGVNVDLTGVKTRRPKLKRKESRKDHDDMVFRELVVASVLHQLSSTAEKTQGVRTKFANRDGTTISIKVTTFGREEEKSLLEAIGEAAAREFGVNGTGGFAQLELDGTDEMDAHEQLLASFVGAFVREYPMLIEMRIENRQPTSDVYPQLMYGLGNVLKAYYVE